MIKQLCAGLLVGAVGFGLAESAVDLTATERKWLESALPVLILSLIHIFQQVLEPSVRPASVKVALNGYQIMRHRVLDESQGEVSAQVQIVLVRHRDVN